MPEGNQPGFTTYQFLTPAYAETNKWLRFCDQVPLEVEADPFAPPGADLARKIDAPSREEIVEGIDQTVQAEKVVRIMHAMQAGQFKRVKIPDYL